MTYEDHLAMKPDRDAEWLRRNLPSGYYAAPDFGLWDLFRKLDDTGERRLPVATGIHDRRNVTRLARLHAAGKRMPYQWSPAFWEDLRRGRRWRVWRARFAWFLRREFLIW